MILEKEILNKETIRSIRILRLADIPLPYHDWLTVKTKEEG